MSNIPRRGHSLRVVTRRNALKMLSALPLAAVVPGPAAAGRTPSATEGPFYPAPRMRFRDTDNDLVKIEGLVRQAGGEVIVLKGRVLDRNRRPINGARVEIWQCDVNGRYLHARDGGGKARDRAFQGFGHVVTGPNGAYEFRTIKPVSYPGRAPHIHVKVFHRRRELTFQLYIAGHPQNARDGLFRRMSRPQQQAVSMAFEDGSRGSRATIDIHL